MNLTLEVSPETARRVEQAQSQGANMDSLLCIALEHWVNAGASAPRSLVPLVGKYEGEAWDELLTEIERNRLQEAEPSPEGR